MGAIDQVELLLRQWLKDGMRGWEVLTILFTYGIEGVETENRLNSVSLRSDADSTQGKVLLGRVKIGSGASSQPEIPHRKSAKVLSDGD